MKTSIFDMNFILPPMIEMVQVVKEMPSNSGASFMGLGCANSATCNC